MIGYKCIRSVLYRHGDRIDRPWIDFIQIAQNYRLNHGYFLENKFK